MRTDTAWSYGRLVRTTAGIALAVATALSASPASAEPASFVKFAGGVGEQAQVVAPAGDVNGDGQSDVIIGAPTATTPRGEYVGAAGAAYVVYGPFVAGTTIELGQLGDKGFQIQGAGAEFTGASVAGAGDVNGDGFDDVLVGAPLSIWRQGRAYVVFGRRRPHTVDLARLGGDGITLRGERYKLFSDDFGMGVAPLGDINRDGLADVGVLASGESKDCRGCFRPGSAYVVFGRRRGGSLSMAKLGRGGFRVGFAVSLDGISTAGDWNADGRPDLALTGAVRRGQRTWVVYGRRYRGMINLARLGKNGVLIHPPSLERPGPSAVTGGQDVDGDGRPDLVVGMPWTHSGPSTGMVPPATAGSVWVIRGSRSPEPVHLDRPGPRAWEIARGDATLVPAIMPSVGGSVTLGAINSDRNADVVFSAGGGLAVLFGTSSHATQVLTALPPDAGFLLRAPVEGGFGMVATAGDMNGDGRADLLAGAPGIFAPGSLPAGAGYLIFLP
jgi:hypothetical protein